MSFDKSFYRLHFNICYLAHFLKYLDKLPANPGLESEDVYGGERCVPVGGVVADVLANPNEDRPD